MVQQLQSSIEDTVHRRMWVVVLQNQSILLQLPRCCHFLTGRQVVNHSPSEIDVHCHWTLHSDIAHSRIDTETKLVQLDCMVIIMVAFQIFTEMRNLECCTDIDYLTIILYVGQLMTFSYITTINFKRFSFSQKALNLKHKTLIDYDFLLYKRSKLYFLKRRIAELRWRILLSISHFISQTSISSTF